MATTQGKLEAIEVMVKLIYDTLTPAQKISIEREFNYIFHQLTTKNDQKDSEKLEGLRGLVKSLNINIAAPK